MALESVSVAETLIQSNDDNDLEDGEIPSDEDDEPTPPIVTTTVVESPKAIVKSDVSKKSFDNKFNKNKKSSSQGSTGNGNSSSSKHDRFLKYKSPSEDWAGDVEKAIRAALEEDGSRNSDSKTKNKNSRNKSRKRSRDDKDEERSKDQKRRKPSEDDNTNEDEDEMLFVRGASPVKKELPPDNDNSPARRSNDHDNHDSSSDYDDRPSINRHRDSEKRNNGRGAGRRGGKNERGGKNKGRGQIRNDRSGRRNQQLDSDSENICVYYMQGKCHRGDDCPYSHDALPPRKMELCKFYLMDCCAKRDKCLYMHHDFPCKYFHTGLKCNAGKNCKFSHQPLNEQVKGILLKHLETAPKEILGDFPRLGREGAMLMIDNTARTLAQGQDATAQKIPSLFELNLQAPMNIMNKNDDKDERAVAPVDEAAANQQKPSRKPSGKKTRWGSDEDRVPYEQVMLLQSANEFGLQLPNAALGLASQQPTQQQPSLQLPPVIGMDFYTESTKSNEAGNKFKENQDFTKDVEEDEILAQAKQKTSVFEYSKDVDLRQLLKAKKHPPPVVSIADEVANLTKKSNEEESDQDEETDLVIEVPGEEDEKDKIVQPEESNVDVQMDTSPQFVSTTNVTAEDQEIPSHLPKKAQELFMRIQQQQRAAQDSFKNMEDDNATHVLEQSTEDWYSDDDDDDDDEEDCGLTIDIPGKDTSKEDSELNEKTQNDAIESKEEEQPVISTPSIPQPAAIVDKLGDLSKIDISAEVSKLLSSLKAQSSTNGKVLKNPQQTGGNNTGHSNNNTMVQQLGSIPKVQQQSSPNTNNFSDDYSLMNKMINNSVNQASKLDGENLSPRSSPGLNSVAMPVSRDPRMSRDPRQRRDDQQKLGSPSRTIEKKKETKHLRLETSIYSSGIIAIDSSMDTDLRTTTDQDLRRKDMDFRQSFQTSFGDTDLRVVNTFAEPSTKSDVDLRQMLSLPFKPVPSHIPCTEIDASIASHLPIVYRVYIVDIPRPDYTGLKLTKNDPQVKYDPRLRKIFRINKNDLTDSPMSPPPMKLDTPKSPPLIRSDPRRKALEVNSSQKSSASMIQVPQQSVVEMSKMGMCPGMPTGPPQTLPTPQGMMGMGGNPMLGNMGPMGSMINNPMNPSNISSMGMTGMPNVTPPMPMNGPPVMSSNQMNFDPRFNAQRNNGAGLLGPAPGVGFGPEIPNSYDGGPGAYPGGNFNNFGPGPSDPGMMGFNPNNGPNAPPNFGMDGPPDWNPGNQNRRGGGGRARRRNRNRTNVANN